MVIDAGHGGEDGGAVGKGNIFEKDLNLDVAFALRDYLVSVGAEVIMTRTEDILLYDRNSDYKGHKKSQDLRKRLEIAEGEEDYVLVSIHMNAFPDERCSGLQVWYSKNDMGSEALARDIQERVKRGLQPGNNRKIKAADSSMYLLDRASQSAVLIECGFLSNEEDLKNLTDEEYRKRLAVLIGGAVYEHIMLPMSNFN